MRRAGMARQIGMFSEFDGAGVSTRTTEARGPDDGSGATSRAWCWKNTPHALGIRLCGLGGDAARRHHGMESCPKGLLG